MQAKETYERKILDNVSDAIITILVKSIDLIRPGWSKKNKSRISEWKLMLYALNRSTPGVIGMIIVFLFLIMAIFGPYLALYKYNDMLIYKDIKYRFIPPLGKGPKDEVFILGTDDYGRDMLSLMLYGARTSLIVAFFVILIGPPLGILLGLISGYFGGKIDEIIMRITDIFLSFPSLLMAIAFAATLTERMRALLSYNQWAQIFFVHLFALDLSDAPRLANLIAVIIAIAIVLWPRYARVVRGVTLSTKENTYVEAARALGMTSWGVMFKHILPNVIAPITVMMTLDIGWVILYEACLSYLGIGAQPPIAEWGRIVYDGSRWLTRGYWWYSLIPGVFILITVLGFNLLGDTLRDVLDPRTRRSIEFKLKRR